MASVVVVGTQWGDEGKGKIIDIYTEHADVVVRTAGGPNAGHTLVVNNQKLIVRLIPSGILHPTKTCILARGMVIDPFRLDEELTELEGRNLFHPGNLFVADRAHTILPYHILVDTLREQGAHAIGTTKRGVGPCYEDKAGRRGILFGDLFSSSLKTKVERALDAWRPVILSLGGEVPNASAIVEKLMPILDRLHPLVTDTSQIINNALETKQNILFEGAQGTLLDIDHGTYPFVTSSSSTAGGACTGAGIGPTSIDCVVGIVKAYCTRVGEGPFPTELHNEMGDKLRTVGGEFGSVTGRPRRIGWLDLPALRYAVHVNGFRELALTKLDILSGLPKIAVCTQYKTASGVTNIFPIDSLDTAEPIYEELEGWQESTQSARSIDELPHNARRYIEFIEKYVSCPVSMIGVGMQRHETIILSNPFDSRPH